MTEPADRENQGTSPKHDAYFLAAGSGSRHLIFPGVELRAIAGSKLMLSVVRLEPESIVRDHSHPHEQMGILLEGKLEFTIGGVTQLLGPGDMWRIPGNVSHRVRALESSVAVDVFHPVRDDYR
jgi:quercetin dioxygenase-like cupin family protein